ncbi:ABC transporter permease [Aquabacter spiritensis]|uniref:NitT/TauT family transport system permease protein n=1 Tax=Aquabacter spiritensis TaxID=933073 RepID=A0A4R3LZV6_9HYPH|nr:ABC transporter permease [Aquabacter spiritensis]TCT05993.1 NitT/TauT family transport system permease protein [Aquabacter spiritensis]
MGATASILWRYTPLLICLALWEIVATAGPFANQLLPDVKQVAEALWALILDGEIVNHGLRSLYRAAMGFGLAIIVGSAAGLLMATFRPVRLLVNPIVQIFYPMPKSALIPVMMIWFGLGDMSKIVLIFIGCLLPVVISSYNGARGVNPFLIWSARSLGASRATTLVQIVLPAAMPELLNGIRTALAFAFILMVSSEFVIAKDGFGYLISQLGDGGAYAAMFAVILVVAMVGFTADRLYGAFVRHQLRWREP